MKNEEVNGLNHIKDIRCPICEAEMIAGGKNNKHSNGNWNEWREFECGYKLEFSPNFMKVQAARNYSCTNDPKYQEKNLKRKQANVKIASYIGKLDVDKEYKNKLLDKVKAYY